VAYRRQPTSRRTAAAAWRTMRQVLYDYHQVTPDRIAEQTDAAVARAE
jgi:hypothetical protein